ncbi:hypothetical protein LCGC14_2137680 [marine sediment metagenome]|uniref:Uncharacterized protein n=1 Tax=marine sediment metagenome TaxID=412755 RepID=A0A0F9GVL1_9ZZZZ
MDIGLTVRTHSLAKVPTFLDLGQVTVGPAPTINASPDAFGAAQGRATAAIGQQTAQFGSEIFEQAERRQIQDNDRESKPAKVALSRILSGIQNDFLTLKGENSLDSEADMNTRIDEAIENSLNSVSNSKVAESLGLLISENVQSTRNTLSAHIRNQRTIAEADASNAIINEAEDNSALNFNNDELLQENIEAARFEAELKALREGRNQIVVLSEKEEAASRVIKSAIIASVRSDDLTRARELFARYTAIDPDTKKSLLDGKDISEMQILLASAEKAQLAEQISMLNLANKIKEEQRKEVTDSYFVRIFSAKTPEDINQLKTEILTDPRLPAFGKGSKKALLDVLESDDKGNIGEELALYDRLHLPVGDPNRIEKDDLPDFAGEVGVKAIRRLQNDADEVLEPLGRAKKDFLARYKSLITRSTIAGKDPQGDDNFGAFKQEVERLLEKAESEGTDPLTLLDDTDANFIGDLHLKWKRSVFEIYNSMILSLGQDLPTTPSIKNKGVARKPKESAEQFLKRTENK